MSPEAFRKTLQRARGKFLELLIQELRETIHPADREDIEAEIFDLGLGHLYRRYSSEARRLSTDPPHACMVASDSRASSSPEPCRRATGEIPASP